jgi:hypothetical protein
MTHTQLYFQTDLTLIRSWYINGKHYSRTLEDWLKKQDRNTKAGLAELEADAKAKGVDKEEAKKMFYRCVSHFSMDCYRLLPLLSLCAIERIMLIW